MEIGNMDSAVSSTRYATQTRDTEQVTKAAEQEGEAANIRQTTIAAPPAAGQSGDTRQAASQQAATQETQTNAEVIASATSSSEDEDDNYQAIVNKANSGQSLTASELNILRSRNPALYAKVAQAGSARQDLRTQMEADPSHASQVMKQAMAEVSREELLGAHNLDKEEQALVKSALQEEYNNFASKYDQVLFGPLTTQP